MARVLRTTFALLLCLVAVPAAAGAAVPDGLTGYAAAGRVELAWQPTAGATQYRVYRGSSPGAVTTQVGATAATTFADTSLPNGTTAYYAVRAVVGGALSAGSLVVQVTPRARACARTANPVASENCEAGNAFPALTGSAGRIEGFATAQSVNRGGAFAVKAESESASFDVEIYRTGWYGGAGARLVSRIIGVPGGSQPGCVRPPDNTGLFDCSGWAANTAVTTTASWPSGVYLLRLVQPDGADGHVLVVVRDDARQPDVLYGVPFTTYAAYNPAGGKSLYDSGSSGPTTISGSVRAVKVSFDRPFNQPRNGHRDWYTRADYATVRWLERAGYDVAYESSADLELVPRARYPFVYMSGSHDEYWSAAMRGGLEAMRAEGVSLFVTGANAVYWKVRFERGGRVLVCYKSTQSGGPDPSGIPTTTWRDPAGANRPENALLGAMYIGDNGSEDFPLQVSAQQSSDRIWRNAIPAGTERAIGSGIVGWEWDARVANGLEPPGVVTVAASPVNGGLLTDAGRVYAPGNATAQAVKYAGPKGSLVFATGTNRWNRGLGPNAEGAGQPLPEIEQATTNVLLDMGVLPSSPAPGTVIQDPLLRPRPGPPLPSPPSPPGPSPGGGSGSTPSPASDPPGGRRDEDRKIRFRWGASVTPTHTRLTRIWVLGLPARGRVALRCSGPGCPETTGAARRFSRPTSRVSMTARVRDWRLLPGAVVGVRARQRGGDGRVLRLSIRADRLPRARRLCLAAGSARGRRC